MNRTDSESNERIGQMLQRARLKVGNVTQQDMAAAIGISKNHLSAVERGQSKASVQLLLGYCEKLELTPNDILGYTTPAPIIIPELMEMLEIMDEEQQNKILDITHIIKK